VDKGKLIVSQFVTLDGVVEDPDGWAFRFGPKRVAGDDFKWGSILDTGVLLVGRRTWRCSPAAGRTALTSTPTR
jgi:hypothetical protein